MKIATIASGSSGNCIYVNAEDRSFLIDAGISVKRIKEGLANYGVMPEDLDGIFITHEHSDHIGGLANLLKKYEIPVYLTQGTLTAMEEKRMISESISHNFNVITTGREFKVSGAKILATRTSHDAAEPVCYKIIENDKRFAIATDLGTYDENIVEALTGVDALLLETNHNVQMLQTGPYPYVLKRRILSEKGHLCNETAAGLLKKIYSDKLNLIILGHLSKTNNYPQLAFETIKNEMSFNNMQATLVVASPDMPSKLYEI